jgi:hypothetical protein
MLHAVRSQQKGSGVGDALSANLSKVELSILLVRDTLNLEEGGVGTGVTLPALMTEYAPFAVESVGK